MAKVKVTLDIRSSSKDEDNKYPLVLRISHKSKTRDIGFDIHVLEDQHSNILPDIICLSKSLSGIGFPFAMNLINPEIDCWKPGKHNGTFRGNNLAFVAGGEASKYWKTREFSDKVMYKSDLLENYFNSTEIFQEYVLRGRGLMRGLKAKNSATAIKLQKQLFKNKQVDRNARF